MTNEIKSPIPLFDTLENINISISHNEWINFNLKDYDHAIAFLKSYKGSIGTFNAYRREVERLLHWSWLIAKKSVKDLRRADIETYLAFCQSPPVSWIGIKKAPRFVDREGERAANHEWRIRCDCFKNRAP